MNKRQITYGSNTIVSIVLVFAALLLLNLIPHKMPVLSFMGNRVHLAKEFDLTSDKRFSLTDETINTLKKIDHPIKVVAFAPRNSGEETKIEEVLKRYAMQSNNFTYRVEDPEANPLLAQTYGVTSSRVMVLESGSGATKKTTKIDLPYSVSDAAALESRLTGALLRELNPTVSTIYFVDGHGERSLDDASEHGLSSLKQALTDNQYVVKPLHIYGKEPIPADASCVVLAGPTKDLLAEEIDNLNNYLNRGGRLLVLSPPPVGEKGGGPQIANLQKFLAARGIALQNDIVISKLVPSLNSAERILVPVGVRYESHPITDKFREMSIFPVARSLQKGTAPTGATVQPLVYTDKDTVEYSDPLKAAEQAIQTQNWEAAYDAKTDKKGEAMLGVAATFPIDPTKASASPSPGASASPSPAASASPASQNKTEARMVVFSDTDFVSKMFLGLVGNEDLALNSIAWLCERTEQIAVKHAEAKKTTASLSEEQKRRLSWMGWPFMPCMIAIIGLFVHMAFKRY